MDLYEIFHETASRQPTRPAILGPGPTDALSYAELADAIRTAAEHLTRAGVRRGDCVGLHCPSGVNYIILTYAVWRCGGCIVPIPVELAVEEKQTICREIALDFVISPLRSASLFLTPFGWEGASELLTGVAVAPIRSSREHPPEFR